MNLPIAQRLPIHRHQPVVVAHQIERPGDGQRLRPEPLLGQITPGRILPHDPAGERPDPVALDGDGGLGHLAGALCAGVVTVASPKLPLFTPAAAAAWATGGAIMTICAWPMAHCTCRLPVGGRGGFQSRFPLPGQRSAAAALDLVWWSEN